MQHLQPNTTLQGGNYKIMRVLGQGGFGITYLAEQVSLNRQVAIKELFIGGIGQAINDRRGIEVIVTNSVNQASFDQQKEKFKKEARRLANLNHPNLVKVHELFEENGTAYYVMDYINGKSLRSKLIQEGKLPEKLVLNYLQQLLPALNVAHQQNIWHLDIKPENIMVDKDGHVYLIDFGASKHIVQNQELTTTLALTYTPGYCPPELSDLLYGHGSLVETLKDIGPWTDIYALGATMYNLLTGNIPPSPNRLYKDGSNAFMFSCNVSSSTQNLIVWMMKPNKEERPKAVKEIISSTTSKINQNGKQCQICGYKFNDTDNRNFCPICKSPINIDNASYLSNEETVMSELFINGNMKPKKGFRLRNVCGENVIVAEGKENVDFNDIISMNVTSAFLWNNIQDKQAFNADYLAKLLTNEYDVDKETALMDTKTLIKQWYKAGIIEKTSAPIRDEEDEITNIREKDNSYSNNFSTANTSNSGCVVTFILSIITTIAAYLL